MNPSSSAIQDRVPSKLWWFQMWEYGLRRCLEADDTKGKGGRFPKFLPLVLSMGHPLNLNWTRKQLDIGSNIQKQFGHNESLFSKVTPPDWFRKVALFVLASNLKVDVDEGHKRESDQMLAPLSLKLPRGLQ